MKYQLLPERFGKLIDHLAAAKCSGVLAGKLRAKRLIAEIVVSNATNYGPEMTEEKRIKCITDVMLLKVQQSSETYDKFLCILEEIDPDYRKLVEGMKQHNHHLCLYGRGL